MININRLVQRKLLLSFSLFFTLSGLYAQDLVINSVSLKGNDVLINYKLVDENLDHKYTLNLYSSQDNYVQPLKMIEGDIGIDQSVGDNKQLVWHAKEELGADFKGDVALEVKGKIYIPFVTLNNFEDITSIKKKRPYTITWAAGRGSSVLTFDLFNKKNEIVHTYTNIANVGEYDLKIPKDIKPGRNYRFRITDQKNKEDVVYTPQFRVKRKIPLYINAALVALAGSSSYLVISSLQGGEETSSGEAPLLPNPSTPF